MPDDKDELYSLLDRVSIEKNLKEDELRMAVGFLDTDKLSACVPGYKLFVALVSLVRDISSNQRKFQLPVRELMTELGLKHNNYQRIEESIEFLMGTILTFNVNRQDNNPGWSKTQILGPSRLENGILHTEFTELVWEKLQNPLVYAYITKRGIYTFSGKHELALYNWFSRLLVPNYQEIYCLESIDYILKHILHLNPNEATTYTRYKYLNQKILTRAIATINEKTNLYVEYQGLKGVDLDQIDLGSAQKLSQHIDFPETIKVGKGGVEYRKQAKSTPKSRKIQYVAFRVWQKRNATAIAMVAVEEASLPEKGVKIIAQMEQVGLVMDKRIEAYLLKRLSEQGAEACIQHLEKVWANYKKMQQRQNLVNPGGYLRRLIFEQINLGTDEKQEQDDWSLLLSKYMIHLEQARSSLLAQADQAAFVAFLKADYESHFPAIQQLCQQQRSLQLSSRGLKLTDPEQVFQKASLVSLLKSHQQAFGYQTPAQPTKQLLSEQQDLLHQAAQKQADPKLISELQNLVSQRKMKWSDFQKTAFEALKPTLI